MKRPDTSIGGFTTLGVPLFFLLAFLTAHFVGLPFALIAAPALFRLALVAVPPPSRLRLPTCPYLARCEAEMARRKAVRLAEQSPRPASVFDPDRGGVQWKGRYIMPDPDRPGVYVLAITPATSADARRAA